MPKKQNPIWEILARHIKFRGDTSENKINATEQEQMTMHAFFLTF
jgi:hypothetical protein